MKASRPRSTLRRALIGAAIGIVSAVLAAGLARLDFFDRVENASYDRRVVWSATPLPPDSPIVIVEINDSSIQALAPMVGRWPWPRIVHAGAIDFLAQSGAKVIAIDVLFLEREGRVESEINGQVVTGDQSDLALAESIRLAGNVVLLAEATFEGLASGQPTTAGAATPGALPGRTYRPGEGFQRRPSLQLPLEDLRRGARGVGHNFLAKDPGGDFARRMLPFITVDGIAVASLGMAAALAYADVPEDAVRLERDGLRIGDAVMPLLDDPAGEFDSGAGRDDEEQSSRQGLLRFPATTRGADGVESVFPTYSFFDVLLSADQLAAGRTPAIPPSAFDGKLVFIGTRAAGTYDRFSTPFASGAAGVELHATFAQSVLAGLFMRRASPRAELALTAGMSAAAGSAALLLPVAWASGLMLALGAVLVTWLTEQVGAGVWMAAVSPLLGGAIALFAGVGWQYFVEGREKREIRRLFGRYVSNDIIEQLMSNPALANLGGERRDMTVLFSDIRGFTAASEKGAPEDVVAQLNEYFGAMVPVLFRHKGTLDKFVGDMIMGLFGAPVRDPDHADRAVAAALEMTATLDALNVKWQSEGRAPLDIGIGINSGEMIAGNIGSAAIMSYTVIGDAVNLGSRIESLNKELGTRVLISEATRARLKRPPGLRPMGEVAVKGRAQKAMVYEVTRDGSRVEAASARYATVTNGAER